jgi:hypothetical protein
MFAKFFSTENLKNVCKLLVKNIVEVVLKTISVAILIPLLQDGLKELNGKYQL